jgi:serine protease Do
VIVAAFLLAGCASAGAGGRGTDAPRGDRASGCADVQAVLARHARAVEAQGEDQKARGGAAATLGRLRAMDASTREAADALEGISYRDERLATSARAYAGGARRMAGFLASSTAKIEAATTELASAGRAVDAAMDDLGRACDGKRAPSECPTITPRLARLRVAYAEGSADVEPMLQELEGVPSPHLDPKVARVAKTGRELVARAAAALARIDAEKNDAADATMRRAREEIAEACGAPPEAPAIAPRLASEWIGATGARADVRKLTVVVRPRMPAPITAGFRRLGAGDDPLAPMYRAVADGGFGSGLVLVKGEGKDKRVFVVTNRHVVDLADDADVALDGGASLGAAQVVYADDWWDLAVLELPRGAPFERGFAFAPDAAKDRLAVVATGFPAVGAQPSFQTARGFVSNERVVISEEGRSLFYVQHTAPIDGGSSGGPLTNEAGELLGVNTMKLRAREGVGLAVPSFAVAEVAHEAVRIADGSGAGGAASPARARDACLAFMGELGARTPRPRVVVRMLSSWLVAREGFESARQGVASDPQLAEAWRIDPVETMRHAVLARIWEGARAAGGVDGMETCEHVEMTEERARFEVSLGKAKRTLALRWERGQWRVAETDILLRPSVPGTAKRGEGTKKGR